MADTYEGKQLTISTAGSQDALTLVKTSENGNLDFLNSMYEMQLEQQGK